MGRTNKYPDQFRKDALELVKSSGRSIAEVARSLGIGEGTLWNWVRAARDADTRAADPDALSEAERDEVRRLRREDVELRPDPEPPRGRAGAARNARFPGLAGMSRPTRPCFRAVPACFELRCDCTRPREIVAVKSRLGGEKANFISLASYAWFFGNIPQARRR